VVAGLIRYPEVIDETYRVVFAKHVALLFMISTNSARRLFRISERAADNRETGLQQRVG
jgi:hypothetical protein